ncbi:Glyoxalase/bleomycin resistance protein/dioxygenase [Xylanimonas cellulosilytica DSM 15894]|uniref:Glyoxalase/bleomycin resistance protein/dioxygenase n=1 Tax=Xylanimonas cellulosilytica (strain DSM 15894 / JCM 12276 / CECT 5975 / KCTC 9989 / LMG 20990 / NBRC 107835 / XIL07) TaxID=446471 RepID=D1BU16_XYLCX|nr:VOC family protein [Xylanimonas cellulosilytica]ACZ29180.1 Glyoxalase/bleomycin resistance protein/dioxygenase [Xylanimonas cellulosilytica DSM 15894]
MSEERRGVGTIDAVVLDVPDVDVAGEFWTTLLGGRVIQELSDGQWLTIGTREGWMVAAQPAPNLVPAQWPSQEHPQQLHLDLRVPDLAAATSAAVDLGATLLRENATWNTLADPAGHPFDLCLSDEVDRTTVWGVTFDVPDAAAAARFWASVLGEEIAYEGEGMAMLGGERTVMFQQVEGYHAPDWPDPARPQQLHLDLDIAGRAPDEAEAAVLALGARRLPGGGATFRVYADPAGHPFCLCWG